MKKSKFLFIAAFLVFSAVFYGKAEAATTYSRNPGSRSFSDPVTFSVSGDDFQIDLGDGDPTMNYWGVLVSSVADVEYTSQCIPKSTLSGSFDLDLPVGDYLFVTVILGATEAGCETTGGQSQGVLLEGNGLYTIFTVKEEGTTQVSAPEIKILSEVPKILSENLAIKYEVSDADEKAGKKEHGLKELPVNIYYQSGEELKNKWNLIAGNQPVSGTVAWDTSKLRDGEYRLRLTATGADGDSGQAVTEPFVLDNNEPVFRVNASPIFSRGEPVDLEIESSESLKDKTVLTIVQAGRFPEKVELKGRPDLRRFTARYTPDRGFDGLAEILIHGEDLAGNAGEAIIGDDSFWVGTKPPPPPSIKNPKNGVVVTEDRIDVEGIAVNAKKIIVKVNGGKGYMEEKIGKRGKFLIRDIVLDPLFNKGRNSIAVSSEDFKGTVSESAVIEVLVNSPPVVVLTEPRSRLLRLNGSIEFAWNASDVNGDTLTYKVELSDDGGKNWKELARDLKGKEFVWDSSQVPDAAGYLARVVASDGVLESKSQSSRITIVNSLPAITLGASGDFSTSEKTEIFKGTVRSKEDMVQRLELSFDDGKTWEEVLPDDGKWDSSLEKFTVVLKSFRTGSQSILLQATSRSGQTVVNAQRLRVFFDDQPPTFISEDISTELSNNPYVRINGVAYDNFTGIKSVEYSIDNSGWFSGIIERGPGTPRAEFKISHSERLKDGEHEIKTRVIDRAGNISALKTQKVRIDATAPRIGSFMLQSDGKVVSPKAKRKFELPLNSLLRLLLSIKGDPRETHLFVNDEEKGFALNEKKLWQADYTLKKDGVIRVVAEDGLRNRKEKEITKVFVR